MIASTQPPCHNRLKLLNSFSVSLLRRLTQAVERAVAYAQGPLIAPEYSPEAVLASAQRHDGYCFHAWGEKTLARLEKEFLKKAFDKYGVA